jgi:ribosomal protein S12 methylthiotransferase
LLDFLQEARLDRVGAFAYSPVEGAGQRMPDPVDEDVKQDRLARFMDVQADISAGKLKARASAGIDRAGRRSGGGRAVARTYADAPEIDGVVHIAQGKGLKPGDFVKVQITRSDDYDLWGKPV